MNLEYNLQSVVEGGVPQDLSPSSIHSLSHDIAQILLSSNKSSFILKSVIDRYRQEVPHTMENNKKWNDFTEFIENALPYNNQDDILRYISGSQQSPTRNLSSRLSHELLNMNKNTNSNLLSPLHAPSDYAESFENIDAFSDRRSFVSSHKSFLNNRNNIGSTLEMLAKPYYRKFLSEDEMVNFIYYTLLATTSDMFPLENEEISIPKNVPNFESGMLHYIFEAGLLYKHLTSIVDENINKSISPMKKTLIMQINSYLRNYASFINNISSPKSNGTASTVKEIYYKLYDKINQLRYFYTLLEDFANTPGETYLKKLNELKNHGDLLVKETSITLFNSLLSYYFEYLIDWLTIGKITHDHQEFFIKLDSVRDDNNTLQNNFTVTLLKDKIPSFIPKHIGTEIYIIGKTYLFLQNYFKDIQWTNTFSKRYNLKLKQHSHFINRSFFDLIHDQYEEIVKHTNDILLKKFYFKESVYLVRNILLMGNGDLIEALIQNSNEILLSPSGTLSSYELTRHLQDAVQQSSMRNLLNRYDSNYLINKLDARVLDLGHGSIGWDVFTLDYILDEPILKILNVNRNGGKKEYLRIFNFLWRFKKNNYFNNTESTRSNMLMRELKKISRNGPLVRDILSKFSKCNILKSQIHQFNVKLETYCFQNIIEKKFTDFEKIVANMDNISSGNPVQNSPTDSLPTIKLGSGIIAPNGILKPTGTLFNNSPVLNSESNKYHNLEELEELHDTFLSNILNNKLLSSSSSEAIGILSKQPYSTSIILILNSIFEFLTNFNALNDITYEVLIQLNLQSAHDEINILLQRFNTVLDNISGQYKNFINQRTLFMNDLRADGDEELFKLYKLLR